MFIRIGLITFGDNFISKIPQFLKKITILGVLVFHKLTSYGVTTPIKGSMLPLNVRGIDIGD